MAHKVELRTEPRLRITHKGTFTVPQNAQTPMFTVRTGKVKVVDIVGEVTTVMAGGVTNTKLVSNPTVGADSDICATADVNGSAVGTMLGVTGTAASALVSQASGSFIAQLRGVIVAPGTIDYWNDQAAATGACKWTCTWIALDDDAEVIAA
jgi:predicted amidohydrolase